MARFAIYPSSDGQYYFIFRASNGEIIVTSETYTTKAAAQNGIAALKRSVAEADVLDMTKK
jgi:uncharacterized protein YegP (UPF0339 family)